MTTSFAKWQMSTIQHVIQTRTFKTYFTLCEILILVPVWSVINWNQLLIFSFWFGWKGIQLRPEKIRFWTYFTFLVCQICSSKDTNKEYNQFSYHYQFRIVFIETLSSKAVRPRNQLIFTKNITNMGHF